MHILDIDSPVKKRLNESGITKLMKSIESCEWAVVEEYENKIIGAAGLGDIGSHFPANDQNFKMN